MFRDRSDAGKQLAAELDRYAGQNAIVVALPRGGVPVAFEVAKKLKLPLDIFSVRKVGHPNNPEYAVCAVDQFGDILCNEEEKRAIDKNWLREEIENERREAERRASAYRGNKKPIDILVSGKIVILVDDGVATGLTLRLAIKSIRKLKPKKIIVALPVGAKDALEILKGELKEGTDELLILLVPEDFLGAVGSYYGSFDQVRDEEVISLLK